MARAASLRAVSRRRSGRRAPLRPAFETLLGRMKTEGGPLAVTTGELAEEIGQQRSGVPFWGEWLLRQPEAPIGALWSESWTLQSAESPSLWLSLEEISLPKAHSDSFGLCCSDLTAEATLLRVASLGYQGLLLRLRDLDRHGLQYLTEIARDLRLSVIWQVSNQAELERVLATDAPYVAVYYEQKGVSNQDAFFEPSLDLKLRERMPDSMRCLCLFRSRKGDEESFLTRLALAQFDAYLDLSLSF